MPVQRFDQQITLRLVRCDSFLYPKISSNKKRQFECKVCLKTFGHNCHLKVHKRSHSGEKPLSCEICQMRFTQISTLIRHKRTHSG